MRAVVLAAILVVATFASPLDLLKQPAMLGGALCIPCEQLIKNGENNEIGNFNDWFTKETDKVCGGLGVLKKECKLYFKEKENEFDHFITSKADPTKSCQEMDFC